MPNWKLCWGSGSGVSVAIRDENFALGPERLVAIPPDLEHVAREDEEGVESLTVHFVSRPRFNLGDRSAYSFAIHRDMRARSTP